MPENRPGGILTKVKKFKLAPEFAVVPLLRLGNAVKVGLELFFVGPGGAINPLQLLVISIAAPLGTGHLGQLESLQLAGAGDVGPATEIHPPTLLIDADFFVARQVFNDLHLIVLTHVAKNFDRLVARADDALDGKIISHNFRHALFNAL